MATKLRRKDVVELLAQYTVRHTPGYAGHIEDARFYWDKGGGAGPLWHLITRAKDFNLLKDSPPTKRTASLRRASKKRAKGGSRARARRARARLRKRLAKRHRVMSLPKAPPTLHAQNLSLLAKADHNLSEAQNSLGRITTMDAKSETPRDYALADTVYSGVETLRRRIYNRR